MIDFDSSLTWKPIAELLDRTTNPRHRKMLTMLLQHSRGEVEEDLDAVMGSLAPHPIYKGVRNGGVGPQPEGWDQIHRFYVEEIFGEGRHVLEARKPRIIVDDDAIVTEGPMRLIRWGRDLIAQGAKIDDPDAVYLMSATVLIVWPFDTEARIIGEESYARPPATFEKIDDADIPERFRTYMDRKKARMAELA
jgi:hypothetical protein